MKKIILILVLSIAVNTYSQINVLVHFTGNETKIKQASDSLHFSYVKLGRMNNVYSLIAKDTATFKPIRRLLKTAPNVTILGVWNKAGNSLIMPDNEDNHTRSKFKARIKRYIRRNESGDIVEDREYTNQELTNGVINKIYGWDTKEF